MLEQKVGRIKNIKINTETENLEVLVEITDAKFKKKLIRDLSLIGKISFKDDVIIYHSEEKDGDL